MDGPRHPVARGQVTSILVLIGSMALVPLIRHQAVGEARHLFLPSWLWILSLATVMVVMLFANHTHAKARRLYPLVAALALATSIAWYVAWDMGTSWRLPNAVGSAATLYLAVALPLILTAGSKQLLAKVDAGPLVRAVVPPTLGFLGTIAIIPFALVVGCALTGDCL